MNKATELVNFEQCPGDPFKANSTPIYQTATFELNSALGESKYDYTRSGNPTRDVLQNQVAKLENGKYGFAFATGMAAINALTGILKPGEHVIAGDDLYGGTVRLFTQRLREYRGISTSFVDVTNLEEVEAAFRPNSKLVLLETPSNPLQKIADMEKIAAIGHLHKAIVAVDNSFMSPWRQQPLDFGVDVVIHSATKYLSGHSDVSGGLLIVNDDSIAKQIAFIQNAEGSALAPFDAWLILRGMKTLGLRISAQEKNALHIIEYLKTQKLVEDIYYPTLTNHPNVKIHLKQASGGGGVVCIRTSNADIANDITNNVKLFKRSVSFGSICSSINVPVNTSHLAIDKNKRDNMNNLIRLSIGIEDHNDLIADLDTVFKKVRKEKNYA